MQYPACLLCICHVKRADTTPMIFVEGFPSHATAAVLAPGSTTTHMKVTVAAMLASCHEGVSGCSVRTKPRFKCLLTMPGSRRRRGLCCNTQNGAKVWPDISTRTTKHSQCWFSLLAAGQHRRNASTQRRSCRYTTVTPVKLVHGVCTALPGEIVLLKNCFTQRAGYTPDACWLIAAGCVSFCCPILYISWATALASP